jgi:general secretion pathway protein G
MFYQSHGLDRRRRTGGFTLVEILIVVIILGILASIVLPQFSNASVQARESTMKDILRFMRSEVMLYQAQHGDVAPGPDAAGFSAQMTSYTDAAGNTSSTSSDVYKFGPYLSQMPANPFNGKTTVTVVANGGSLPAPDGSTGWIYKPQTLQFIANVAGSDAQGVAYSNY